MFLRLHLDCIIVLLMTNEDIHARALEQGDYQHGVTETAMGHTVGNTVEQAYLRTDVLGQRKH